jgi:hypothetical protein
MPIKEENLLPYEGIIKPGQRLMKIGNTFMPVGIGGAFEPAGIKVKEVGYDTLYECASVGGSTWTGYKLVLTDGFYEKAETLTDGLTFGTGYKPSVGTVYNADATIKVGKYNKLITIPEDGLVFFLQDKIEAENDIITSDINILSKPIGGEQSLYFNGSSSRIILDINKMPTCTASKTFATRVYIPSDITLADLSSFCTIGGRYNGGDYCQLCMYNNCNFYVEGSRNYDWSSTEVQDNFKDAWHHVAFTYDKDKQQIKLYIDGVVKWTLSDYFSSDGGGGRNRWEIGCGQYDGQPCDYIHAYMRNIRVYDRALTDEEMMMLAREA